MAHRRRQLQTRISVRALVISCAMLVTSTTSAREVRPPLSAACRAWDSHIAELIDEHRTAQDLDDETFGEIIRHLYEARMACSALHFEEGLSIYEAIPIGPVASRLLR